MLGVATPLASLLLLVLALLPAERGRARTWRHTGFFTLFALFAAAGVGFLAAGLPPYLVRVSPAFTELLVGWQRGAGLTADLAERALGAANYDYLEREPPSPTLPGTGQVLREYGFSLLNVGLAAVLMLLRPRDRTARLLALGMVGTGAVFNQQAHAALAVAPGFFNPLHDSLHILGGIAYLFAIALFPDGRLKPRWRELPRWRWPLRGLGLVLVPLLGIASIGDTHGGDAVTYVAVFGIMIPAVGLVSQAARYRHAASPEERRQSRLFIAALTSCVGGTATLGLLWALLATTGVAATAPTDDLGRLVFLAFPVLFAALPVVLFVILIRFRLWDIDRLATRVWAYGALASFIGAVYVAVVVVGSHVLVGTDEPSLVLAVLATAIVAVAFDPLRRRLQNVANRLVYGQRATPYEVLAEFSGQVGETFDVEEVLPRTARVVADGTSATRAEVWLAVGDELLRVAVWPDEAPAADRVPLDGDTPAGDDAGPAAASRWRGQLPPIPAVSEAAPVVHRGELLGALAVATAAGEPLAEGERRLLEDLAAQAGLVLRNVRLTEELRGRFDELSRQADELRASRQRIVAARDAERRRLERDIHDGAQQHLVALAVKLRLAATAADRDAEQARAIVHQLRDETAEALESLRNLARGIYPSLLTDQGLAVALRGHADRAPLPLVIEGEGVGRYPEEVEIAVYFCCLEAIQNAVKHAGATEIRIHLAEHDGSLLFSISDDGTGFDPDAAAEGRGLTNMTDRLAAVDGEVEVASHPGRGTTVRGRVPIAELEPAG